MEANVSGNWEHRKPPFKRLLQWNRCEPETDQDNEHGNEVKMKKESNSRDITIGLGDQLDIGN